MVITVCGKEELLKLTVSQLSYTCQFLCLRKESPVCNYFVISYDYESNSHA